MALLLVAFKDPGREVLNGKPRWGWGGRVEFPNKEGGLCFPLEKPLLGSTTDL